MKVNYHLAGGYWDFKDEVKVAFYQDLYNFVLNKDSTILDGFSFNEFIISEPYIIGNLLAKYYLEENVGSTLEEQSADYFIGYCFHHNKHLNLINHLIIFFALWRDIEGCREENATDFFASSWASLVDTAKFFKYTTLEELKNSPESPTVQDVRILYSLQNCPDEYPAPVVINKGESKLIPSPRKKDYVFLGWYEDVSFKGEAIKSLSYKDNLEINLFAKWGTHTFFHANDSYKSFDEIYVDFLNDFSTLLDSPLTQEKTWMGEDGWVSDFCKKSQGLINKFFGIEKFNHKWMWLIDYFISLYSKTPDLAKAFIFENGSFYNEDHLRWELNSLFVSRYHLIYPKTKDYSGAGIKEALARSRNSFYIRIDYVVGSEVNFPQVKKDNYRLLGWYLNSSLEGEQITFINDDSYAAKTLYAKWEKP